MVSNASSIERSFRNDHISDSKPIKLYSHIVYSLLSTLYKREVTVSKANTHVSSANLSSLY